MRKPTCTTCGTEVEPGTLLTHALTAHPKVATPAPKRYTCRAAKCTEVYGPRGHVPGVEGPHAY
jgi:hypothetical protein